MASIGSKQFPWVPNGIYDHRDFNVRYAIKDGCNKSERAISKMWVDQGGPDDVSLDLKQPWGTYPDMPPKPPKK
jgi:hypothetical protein